MNIIKINEKKVKKKKKKIIKIHILNKDINLNKNLFFVKINYCFYIKIMIFLERLN
jgi:hypothetical protein